MFVHNGLILEKWFGAEGEAAKNEGGKTDDEGESYEDEMTQKSRTNTAVKVDFAIGLDSTLSVPGNVEKNWFLNIPVSDHFWSKDSRGKVKVCYVPDWKLNWLIVSLCARPTRREHPGRQRVRSATHRTGATISHHLCVFSRIFQWEHLPQSQITPISSVYSCIYRRESANMLLRSGLRSKKESSRLRNPKKCDSNDIYSLRDTREIVSFL